MPDTLNERLATIRDEAHTILNTAQTEGRPLTSEEQARFDAALAAGNELLEAINNQAAATSALAALAAAPAPTGGSGRNPRDFGQAFIDSPVVADLRRQYPDGIPNGTRVQTGSTRVGDLRNALLTDPALVAPMHVIDAPTNVAVFDLLSAITIIDDAPQAIKTFTAAFTNAAAVVAEGALKPESTLTWTPATINQATIAHHIPVTNQALSHNPMLRQIVNTFMINGVRAKVQAVVAAAVAAASGIGVQAFATNIRTTLRKAITQAQVNGELLGAGRPSILISATDAESLDLEQLSNLVLSPGEAPAQASGIWRAPLVVSAALPSGFAYVGDLRQIVFYTSGGINVSTGWVDDQFIRNSQTILAETEGITSVQGAPALIKSDIVA